MNNINIQKIFDMKAFLNLMIVMGLMISSFTIQATPLDDMAKKAKDNPQSMNAGSVIALLNQGIKEQRAPEAIAALKLWLSENSLKDKKGLFTLAMAYDQAGQWPEAVRYYQRFLKEDNLDSKQAAEAVDKMYKLLLYNLGDLKRLYAFMLTKGASVRKYGEAKKMDHWFLKQAVGKRDVLALTEFLKVVFSDPKTDYSKYYTYIESLIGMLPVAKYEMDVYKNVEKLSELKPLAKYKYKLLWSAKVNPYNFELDKTIASKKEKNVDIKKTQEILKLAEKRIASDPENGLYEVARQLFGVYSQRDGEKRTAIHGDLKKKFITDQLLKGSQKQMSSFLRSNLRLPNGHNLKTSDYFPGPENNRKLVKRFPDYFNNRNAPQISLFDKTITVKEAEEIAPNLRKNISLDAGVIRAFAKAGPSFKATVPALVRNEMWRYKRLHEPMRLLWDKGPSRDGDYNKLKRKYEKMCDPRNNPQYKELLAKSGKLVSGSERIATFKKVYDNITGDAPSIQGGNTILKTIMANSSNAEKDELFSYMINNEGSNQDILRDVLERAKITVQGNKQLTIRLYYWNFTGNSGDYRKYLPKTVAKINSAIRAMLAKGPGKISQNYFAIWYNVQNGSKKDIELMKKVAKDPAFQDFDKFKGWAEGTFRDTAFKKSTTKQTASNEPDPELARLQGGMLPKQIFSAFNKAVERMAKTKQIGMLHKNIQLITTFPKIDSKTMDNAKRLFSDLAPKKGYYGTREKTEAYEKIAIKIINEIEKSGKWNEILEISPGLWRWCHHSDITSQRLADFAEAAIEADKVSVASIIVNQGINSRIGSKVKSRIKALVGKTRALMGVADVLVDKDDPAFNIFKAQAEYLQGNEDSAISLVMKDPEKVGEVVPKLNPDFCIWLIDAFLKKGETKYAKLVGQNLYIKSVRQEGSLDTTQEGQLKLAMGDIAFKDGNFDRAKSQYNRIISSREYRGTEEQFRAYLGVVKVDMTTKNFGAALSTLEKLLKSPDSDRRHRAYHIRARVYYEQGAYSEARKDVETILKESENYQLRAEALILKGDLDVKERNFEGGLEVEVGSRDAKTTIIPGEPITIKLEDQTLSISGDSSSIEVEVYAKSGDSERILLRAEGDDKSVFKARIMSQLGKPKKGDKILQILGEDEVRYGYSKRFRKKMKDLPPDNNIVMTVKSNASIAMSAGAFPPRKGERSLDLDKLGVSSSQKALGTRRVRPGNPLYIRVIDPDHSKTSGRDKVRINIKTSSGDYVNNVELTETTPYSGEFEGEVSTASAVTTASASDTEKGLDPNNAISPKKGEVWKGDEFYKPRKDSLRYFKVDFNDKVPLGKLEIDCVKGNELNKFMVQTSLDGSKWVSRVGYPKSAAEWDGKPEMALAFLGKGQYGNDNDEPILPKHWKDGFEINTVGQGNYKRKTIKNLQTWDDRSPGHPGYTYLLRYRMLFFQPSIAERTFRLEGITPKGNNTLFFIDGKASSNPDDMMTITRELRPGIHEIQIWHYDKFSNIKKLKPVLLSDKKGSDELKPCHTAIFQPSSFPNLIRKKIPNIVKIKKNKENSFTVDFGKNIDSRIVRLVILGYEGKAPGIAKMEMNDRLGKKRLPTDSDYRELRTNNRLEVLPGDQISAIYEDDNFIGMTRKKKIDTKGANVSVAFNNGTLTASFLNYINTDKGRELKLENIRRFRMGDNIAFVIEDMDMDISPKLDEVVFKVTTSNGFSRELKALETDAHSGRFIGRFFPQLTESKRPAEIQITRGATITAVYLDKENTDPGIPAERKVTIEHAKYKDPVFEMFTVSTDKYSPDKNTSKNKRRRNKISKNQKRGGEQESVAVRRTILRDSIQNAKSGIDNLKALINSNITFNVNIPHLALANSSRTFAYVQTESGRKMAMEMAKKEGKQYQAPANGFDVNVPGTLKVEGQPSFGGNITAPPGYIYSGARKNDGAKTGAVNKSALDKGTFAFNIPVKLGATPQMSYANRSAEALTDSEKPDFLSVRPGDKVYIAYPYFAEKDFYDDKKSDRKPQWFNAQYDLESHLFLDMMHGDYNKPLKNAFVGEKVYLRIIAPSLDTSENRDSTQVLLKASNGVQSKFSLHETEVHSGIFKGIFKLSYLTQKDPNQKLPPVELNGFPVIYGDTVTVSYPNKIADAPDSLTMTVNKGADGLVKPYSKRFADSSIAIKTSFTMAECFFELARQHKLASKEATNPEQKKKLESASRMRMQHAEKLLKEALDAHRDEEQQAHAEYLLGNLAQEYASLSKNDAVMKSKYSDALVRYKKVVSDYPEAMFAPKAQYKVAYVYDKMDKIENIQTMDIAIEEYVKLAYKYPQDELIPKVMSRIGTYFQDRGKKFKDQAKEIEKKGKEGDGEHLLQQAQIEYLKAANVFNKLYKRFPSDPLAPLAELRAAQNYMRADLFDKAADVFLRIMEDEERDGETIRAQAMYWAGICYEKGAKPKFTLWKGGQQRAVQLYNRTRYEFPSSKWAKYARGRLVDPGLAEAVKVEEQRKEYMLEQLKK